MRKISKAEAAKTKKSRSANAKATGELMDRAFGAVDAAERIRFLILEEGKRLQGKGVELTNEQRSMVLVRMTGLAEKLSKITGEGVAIDERKFLRSANGLKFKATLLEALRPFPDAARAVAKAIRAASVE